MIRLSLILMAILLVLPTPASAQERKELPAITGNQIEIDVYGNMTVLDSDRNMVRLYSKEGALLREVGGRGWENDQFDRPAGIWARNGIDIFVADYGNHRIQRFDRKLNFVSSLSTRDNPDPAQRFGYPTGVALSRLGDLFICDGENSRVVKVNRFNQVERTFGGFDAGKGRLHNPTAIQIGPADFVYVLDGKRIVTFDNFGNFIHDLMPEVLVNPTALFVHGTGVAVLSESTLFCFDQKERPVCVVPLVSIIGKPVAVRGMAFGGGLLCLLTDSGLTILPDPCVAENEEKLDKER